MFIYTLYKYIVIYTLWKYLFIDTLRPLSETEEKIWRLLLFSLWLGQK